MRPAQGDAPRETAMSRPPVDVPLWHWSYPLLERLVARGIVDIDLSTLPVSRATVADALVARGKRGRGAGADSPALSDRERWALERLEAEFMTGEVDAPALAAREGDASVGLGIMLGSEMCYTRVDRMTADDRRARGSGDDEIRCSMSVLYDLWGGVADLVGFYSDAAILLEGQGGPRAERLSGRARTWRGIAATMDRAYVKLERPHFSVTLGRRGTAWGCSRRGRLLVSGSAPTFDGLWGDFAVGALSFHALHARLEYEEIGTEEEWDDGDHAFLAAHRIVFGYPRGSVGVSEAVVYSGNLPDPAYLNPVLPYYVSQHNERANDNVLWSLDFVHRLTAGLEIYGEFLVDDLQYERNTGHPDKYGITIGEAYYGHAFGSDFAVTAEYSNVRKWTYTHSHVEHRYAQDGRPIGFDLGPDSDRVTLEVIWHPALRWSLGAGYTHSRQGEGTITEPFQEGEDYAPEFPSGNVVTIRRATLELGYEDLEGFLASFGAAFEDVDTEGGSGGDGGAWEFWAGVEFRI